jgi:hypothetical protein
MNFSERSQTTMAREGDNTMICPSCHGNGFLTPNVPAATATVMQQLIIGFPSDKVGVTEHLQCPVCDSLGEIEGDRLSYI